MRHLTKTRLVAGIPAGPDGRRTHCWASDRPEPKEDHSTTSRPSGQVVRDVVDSPCLLTYVRHLAPPIKLPGILRHVRWWRWCPNDPLRPLAPSVPWTGHAAPRGLGGYQGLDSYLEERLGGAHATRTEEMQPCQVPRPWSEAERVLMYTDPTSRNTGATVWLTGLSGAGKSTIAEALASEVGDRVQVLDGDELRTNLSVDASFSHEDRTTHVIRVGFVAELLARHGVTVIVAVIAPYAAARAAVRAHHTRHGTPYCEVYVATPIEVCRRRDTKGLYARSAAGKLSGLTGVDDPYEIPITPDLTIDTQHVPVPIAVSRIRGLLTDLRETV